MKTALLVVQLVQAALAIGFSIYGAWYAANVDPFGAQRYLNWAGITILTMLPVTAARIAAEGGDEK